MSDNKKDKNGIKVLATSSDIADMMGDKIEFEKRFGIKADPIVGEMDRMDERMYGKLGHKGVS